MLSRDLDLIGKECLEAPAVSKPLCLVDLGGRCALCAPRPMRQASGYRGI
jgi:hypothetical protein